MFAAATEACAWLSDDPKNRLLMRVRNDDPPEADGAGAGAGAESRRPDEQPATAASSRIAVIARPVPHTPLTHPFIALDHEVAPGLWAL